MNKYMIHGGRPLFGEVTITDADTYDLYGYAESKVEE